MAGEEARQLGHHHIGTEHLLLGLLSDRRNPVTRALPTGTSVQVVRRKVAEAVGSNGTATDDELTFTPRAKRALERASRFSLQRHDDEVGTVHVLLGVLDVEGRAGQVLRGLGVDVGRLRDAAEQTTEQPKRAPSRPPATVLEDDPSDPTGGDAISLAHQRQTSPRCSECGSVLDTALAFQVLAGHDDEGKDRDFVVVYCATCGSSLGATPA